MAYKRSWRAKCLEALSKKYKAEQIAQNILVSLRLVIEDAGGVHTETSMTDGVTAEYLLNGKKIKIGISEIIEDDSAITILDFLQKTKAISNKLDDKLKKEKE